MLLDDVRLAEDLVADSLLALREQGRRMARSENNTVMDLVMACVPYGYGFAETVSAGMAPARARGGPMLRPALSKGE